jgi:hypothetical protein
VGENRRAYSIWGSSEWVANEWVAGGTEETMRHASRVALLAHTRVLRLRSASPQNTGLGGIRMPRRKM